MTNWNGFDKGVIGRKLPSDKTLNNMRKADLIELLHIAEDNHNVLAFAYKNAVDNSKCNKCPISKMSAEHDKYIRAEAINEVITLLYAKIKNKDELTTKEKETNTVISLCIEQIGQLKEQK